MDKSTLLFHFIKRYEASDFKTGTNDCALFAAAWVKRITGHDLAKRFIGQYKNDIGSARLIKRFGYDNLERFVESEMDRIATRVNPLSAQRGDIAWAHNGTEMVCGIVDATGVVVLAPSGITRLRIQDIKLAWRL